MPWKDTCPMKERQRMIELHQTGRYSIRELADEFGVSRKTIYVWLQRYARDGPSGLEGRCRAPHTHPNATPPQVVAAVVRAKATHPTWGPAKLLPGPDTPHVLKEAWPATSTRGRILARAGLVTPRRHRRRTPPWTQPFHHSTSPNAVWCADFKGWFRTADGTRCDPLTVTDAFSRLLLACVIVPRPDHGHVRPVFEELFREYGLPQAIRTDNGPPFASVGAGGLSPLAVWWIKLGIVPERIMPGHPEQNGRHERMHGTLKRETMRPPATTPQEQQERCDLFRVLYNQHRPHQALGQVPPAAMYVPSPQQYPDHVEDLPYPDTHAVRRVRSNGQIKWGGGLVFVSEALVGEVVGITEDQQGWVVCFGPIALGRISPHKTSLERLVAVPPSPPSGGQESQAVTYVPS